MFSAVNSLRVTSQRLGSVFGLASNTDNPMKSPTSGTGAEPKKRVTSGEFHLNYLGYESVSDLPSGRIVSDISQIRLDQDRQSDVIVDPFRSTFPSQRSATTEPQVI